MENEGLVSDSWQTLTLEVFGGQDESLACPGQSGEEVLDKPLKR
jgi:hypothetical protein